MKKFIHWLDVNFEAFFGMIAFFAMLSIILMQIILRNLFGAGTPWGEEICRFCYVWVCYIGLGYATKNNIQIEIDAVRRNLPEKAQKVLIVFAEVVMLLLFLYLFRGTLDNAIRVYQKNARAESINISSNWMYVAGPVGYGLGIVRCLQTLVWKIRHFKCSMPVFFNPNGVLSGSLETYCYNAEILEEQRACVSAEVYEEAAAFREKHHLGKKKED